MFNNPLSDEQLVNIFYNSVGCLLIQVTAASVVQNIFNLE
jgi:hypothetical protein